MKSLAILIGVPLALWLALLYPSWLVWGDDAILQSGVALALCLAPAIATYLATARFTTTTDQRMLASLGSTGLRMIFVLGIGMLLHAKMGERFPAVFMYWLALFYLLILGLEVWLLVRQSSTEDPKVSL